MNTVASLDETNIAYGSEGDGPAVILVAGVDRAGNRGNRFAIR